MNAKHHYSRFIAPAALAAVLLFPSAFAQQAASTIFRPSLLAVSAGNYSYSGGADFRHGVPGSVAVHHAEVSLSGRRELTGDLLLGYGLDFDTSLLVADDAVPLPDQLSVFSVNLGLIRPFNREWTAAVFARPGFYSDFEHLGRRSLNLPVLVSATYAPRDRLKWTFAVRFDSFSRNTVLPVVGVEWQFAPDWEFALGFPRSGLTWRMNDEFALRAAASFQGGSYRVTTAPAALPSLADSLVDYREIRLGLGADWKVGDRTTLALDAGLVADRRFDYHQRSYRLDGKSALFFQLAFINRR